MPNYLQIKCEFCSLFHDITEWKRADVSIDKTTVATYDYC